MEIAGDAPAPEFDPTTRRAEKEWVIGYAHAWAALDFDAKITESVMRAAEKSGVKIVGNCDIEYSPEKAVTCAEQLVALSPDAVIFPNWRVEAWPAVMKIFDAAKIPVTVADVWAPNAIFFGGDNYTAGTISGKAVGEYAKETWNCEGVWILLGEQPVAGPAADLRLVGFRDGVRTFCDVPDSQVARVDQSEGSTDYALTVTADWLTGNPEAERVLCQALDDTTGTGMARALQQAGREGVCGGQAAELVALERIREGSVEETRYLGTVGFFPELYGVYDVAIVIDLLEGKAVPQEVHAPHAWIDRSNIDEFYDEDGNPVKYASGLP